jgi:hydrogenase maturation protein HypF
VEELKDGLSGDIITARFRNGLGNLIQNGCVPPRERHGLSTVALSGGVFQDQLLLRRTLACLGSCGFTVLRHSRRPGSDGGISLGQAVVAAARDRLTCSD